TRASEEMRMSTPSCLAAPALSRVPRRCPTRVSGGAVATAPRQGDATLRQAPHETTPALDRERNRGVIDGGNYRDGRPSASPHPVDGPGPSTALPPYPANRYAKTDTTSPTGLRVFIDRSTTGDPMISALASTIATLDESDGFSTIGACSPPSATSWIPLRS